MQGIRQGDSDIWSIDLETGASSPLTAGETWDSFAILPLATVPPHYFELLGTPLVAGRALRTGDHEERNVVVDRDFAVDLFGMEAPLGRRFRVDADGEWRTVVGVVRDLKLGGIEDELGSWAMIQAQDPDRMPAYIEVAVRSTNPGALLGPMRTLLAEIDPQQPVRRLFTAREALGESMARPRFLLVLMVVMAALALVLAAVGTYGVMAYAVRHRRRETGIRLALGAGTGDIRRTVLGSGLTLGAVGVSLGLALAAAVTRFAEGLLYGVAPLDPAVFGVAGVVMIVAAAVACWIPARRAVRVDPVEVLSAV